MNANFRDESAPIFYELKLLPISKIYHLNFLKFLFNCLDNNSFPFLSNRILYNSSTHNHETRFRNQLKPIRERLDICKNSYLSQSVSLWNNLDDNIKKSRSLSNFKHKVKESFIDTLC